MPSEVRLATPLEKSVAWFNTFEPWIPETVPLSGELAVTVTLLLAALKFVTVLSYRSWAVSVLIPVKTTPSVWGLAATKAKWSKAAEAPVKVVDPVTLVALASVATRVLLPA